MRRWQLRGRVSRTYLTPISTDSLGDLLVERLEESNVTISAPRVVQPTSLAVVSLDGNGVPSYAFHRNGTAERQVSFEGLAKAMPSDTTILHVGGLALIDGDDANAWEAFFYDCADRGILTSLDECEASPCQRPRQLRSAGETHAATCRSRKTK